MSREARITSDDKLIRVFKTADKKQIKVVEHIRGALIGQTVAVFAAEGKGRHTVKDVIGRVKSWNNVN